MFENLVVVELCLEILCGRVMWGEDGVGGVRIVMGMSLGCILEFGILMGVGGVVGV